MLHNARLKVVNYGSAFSPMLERRSRWLIVVIAIIIMVCVILLSCGGIMVELYIRFTVEGLYLMVAYA